MRFGQTLFSLFIGIIGMGATFSSPLQVSEVSSSPVSEAAPTQRPADSGQPDVWPAPTFSAVDQHGKRVTDQDLSGHVWVAAFLSTHCPPACSKMAPSMISVLQNVPHPDVRFVSFAVDPNADTPEALKQYAAAWKRDESRWLLIKTDGKTLSQIATRLKVALHSTDNQDSVLQPGKLLFLVNQQNIVQGVYKDEGEFSLKKLAFDALHLLHGDSQTTEEASAKEISPQAGERLFNSLDCAHCHSQSRFAPALAGLFGASVQLKDGQVVSVDEAYLRESILDPNAKIVAGYPGFMPTYRGRLDDAQVDQLVAYLRTLGKNPVDASAGKGEQDVTKSESSSEPHSH